MARKSSTFNRLAIDWAFAGASTAATLWHRLSLTGAFAMMSEADRKAETERMFSEKLAAGFEGGIDAGVQAMRIMAAAACGRLGAEEFLNAPSAIVSAGLQPAMRRVRANSRRLNRRAKSSKS